MCTAGGQNVCRELISLKAGDNWRLKGKIKWYAKWERSKAE